MTHKMRGFTLIELLVVIAIIGMLSAIVLGQLNNARNKGADAAIKSNLNNIRAQAELVMDSDPFNRYSGVCANQQVLNMTTAAGGVCNNSATAWAASAPLKQLNQVSGSSGTDYWCVDSKGTVKLEDSALGSAKACP